MGMDMGNKKPADITVAGLPIALVWWTNQPCPKSPQIADPINLFGSSVNKPVTSNAPAYMEIIVKRCRCTR